MYRILHLSDMHFGEFHFFRQNGKDTDSPTLPLAVESSLKQLYAKISEDQIDVTILSGDFFCHDHKKDYKLALENLRFLRELPQLKNSDFVCVPGNHDLIWDKPSIASATGSVDVFQFYNRLMKALQLQESVHSKFPRVISLDPRGEEKRGLAIIALDSCRLEGKNTAGLGRVGPKQLEEMKSELTRQTITPETHVILAVTHHHLLPVHAEEPIWDPRDPKKKAPYRQKYSFTVDARDVLNTLADNGVAVLLHGHQHKAMAVSYRDFENNRPPIHILASGSCGSISPKGAALLRHFSVYDISDGAITPHHFYESDRRRFALRDGDRSTLPLFPPRGADSCSFADRVHYLKLGKENYLYGRQDSSDLYLLLLSVEHCPKTREAIRQIVSEISQSQFWADKGLSYFILEGMYDLLGKWDLAVRIRSNSKLKDEDLNKFFEEELNKRKLLIYEYTGISTQDITNEWPPLNDSETNIPHRTRLLTTNEYERNHCQRAFVCIDLNKERGDESQNAQTAQAIKDELRKRGELMSIVESIQKSKRYLIIDIFMKCNQKILLNKLNRELEDILDGHQKYTLSCYGYDEEEIIIGRIPLAR